MSFIYSRALVEEFSEATSSDGAQSVLLSGNPTPQAYCAPDKMTAFSRLSRFGMTFKPLMDTLGEDVLTWCQAASRARTSALPAKVQALTEPAAECGDIWRGSLARFDPASSSWRTAQPSLLGDSDESSVTWPRSGMTVNGQCWALPMLGRRIRGIDSGLWPTITVCGNYNRKGASATSGDGLITALRTWPKPISRDSRTVRGGARMKNSIGSEPLITQVAESEHRTDGRLNPVWVEWLMGWPLGWTDLKPLATDKFQPALPPPGDC